MGAARSLPIRSSFPPTGHSSDAARHPLCGQRSASEVGSSAKSKKGESRPWRNHSETEGKGTAISRDELIGLLNEDLARVSGDHCPRGVLAGPQGAEYMSIAKELEVHAGEELAHALTIAGQIDYLGGQPTVTVKPVKTSDRAEDMLRFDLDNENETIRAYRERVRQCEALGEYAIAEHIREILIDEQEHQVDLATALGIDAPDVSRP